MKRKIDMLELQMEQLQGASENRKQLEDEIVEWEQGQVLTTSPMPMTPNEVSVVTNIEDVNDLNLIDIQRETIQRALNKNKGNRKATAIELGLSERTLYRKIKEYGLQ
jgi:DNA-binding NtrC family response regulator